MKNVLVVMMLVVITSAFGQSKTVDLKDTKDVSYNLCMPQGSMENILKTCTVDWCKFVKDEQNMYTKMCILNIEDKNISRMTLISVVTEDSTKRVECGYIEFMYNDKILYVQKADKKIWWQTTNLLNNAIITSPE